MNFTLSTLLSRMFYNEKRFSNTIWKNDFPYYHKSTFVNCFFGSCKELLYCQLLFIFINTLRIHTWNLLKRHRASKTIFKIIVADIIYGRIHFPFCVHCFWTQRNSKTKDYFSFTHFYMWYFKRFHFEFYITHDRHPSLCSSIENVFEMKTYFVHFTTSVQNELYENMLVAQTVCKQNWFLQQGNNLLQCQHPPWWFHFL